MIQKDQSFGSDFIAVELLKQSDGGYADLVQRLGHVNRPNLCSRQSFMYTRVILGKYVTMHNEARYIKGAEWVEPVLSCLP